VEDEGELDMPTCCRPRGEVQGHLLLHQCSERRCGRACCLSHHFDPFCGGHLLFLYVCSIGIFGAIHRCFKHHCMRM